jgi:aminoglycoside phosphotransferase (APT) family kinase protein
MTTSCGVRCRSSARRWIGCARSRLISRSFATSSSHTMFPETVQHDDLHRANVYTEGGKLRVLDWGDSSISHPFVSLVVTFRFLEEVTKLPPGDPWFARLRDAYLEPWGRGLEGVFALAWWESCRTFWAHLRNVGESSGVRSFLEGPCPS